MTNGLRIAANTLTLMLLIACASTAADWVFLGERTAAKGGDRDEIRVGAREGAFSKIQLRVRGSALTVQDVKVHYANGDVEDVSIRAHIPAGGESRVIDLTGTDRVIEKVVFWYRTPARARGRATVRLFGSR